MKTGLTPAESMVVNGGERSNAALAGSSKIDKIRSRRRLGCTSTRWAERHPQGVCRIRKAAEPPTAAQQRVVGAEASRIAALNAASLRAASSDRQAPQLFELHA